MIIFLEVVIFAVLATLSVYSAYKGFPRYAAGDNIGSLIWLVCIYFGCAYVALSIGSMLSH